MHKTDCAAARSAHTHGRLKNRLSVICRRVFDLSNQLHLFV
ncbi:hypothetical protein HMPREF9193_02187 [Treponema lecithinolyticum ATCC 700332]|uniref:Uncharacterized protein n=1 Tax=Treponema lecithinolyticum ATCC 700332 TaxID=1321815 RepID=A0ABN0NVY4_TRELE|nr:hypothetical protein HMPREF9193_02187 [Treponema lecithinolyticum ATCC 700332]